MHRNVPAEKASAQAIHHCCAAALRAARVAHQAEVEDEHADRNASENKPLIVCRQAGSSRRGPSAC